MANYAMVIKKDIGGTDIIFKTQEKSLEEAKKYFSKLKKVLGSMVRNYLDSDK